MAACPTLTWPALPLSCVPHASRSSPLLPVRWLIVHFPQVVTAVEIDQTELCGYAQDAAATTGMRGIRKVYRMTQDAEGNVGVETSEHNLEDELDWLAQARVQDWLKAGVLHQRQPQR